jgi:DNA ligase (NAD+)
MNDAQDITDLANRIIEANDYYFNGTAKISDEEYDALKDKLRELAPNHEILALVGATPATKRKNLPIPMSSQEKVNSPAQAISWAESKGVKQFCVQEKLDGMSVLAEYKDGVFVRAYSRGDGITGEDISENFVLVQGYKSRLNGFSGYLKGEIILHKSTFASCFANTYSNTRNCVAGLIRKESGEEQRHLSVYFYDVVGVPILTEQNKIKWLTDNDLQVPRTWTIPTPEELSSIPAISEEKYRDSIDYDIDGLVLKINNISLQESFGRHGERENGNPRGQIALKFAAEMRETVLTDIEWDVGLVGRITPVAILEPVSISGVTISRASLYNAKYISDLNLSKGAMVLVSRRNDVIPKVERALNHTGICFDFPQYCPSCKNALSAEGEYLICSDPSCRVLGSILKWVTNFNILHIGPQTIKALIKANLVSDVADLYTLNLSRSKVIEMFGEKSTEKILTEIANSKSSTVHDMLGSLNIPLCGRRLFKKIVDSGFDSVEKIQALSTIELTKIPGIGEDRALQIVKGLIEKREVISKLVSAGLEMKTTDTSPLSHVLAGKSFCFTGEMTKPRKYLEKAVLEHGGSLKGVSKGLDFLVASSAEEQSAKLAKAQKYGIRRIDEETFLKMIGEKNKRDL